MTEEKKIKEFIDFAKHACSQFKEDGNPLIYEENIGGGKYTIEFTDDCPLARGFNFEDKIQLSKTKMKTYHAKTVLFFCVWCFLKKEKKPKHFDDPDLTDMDMDNLAFDKLIEMSDKYVDDIKHVMSDVIDSFKSDPLMIESNISRIDSMTRRFIL